jgi:hypothetical protein
VSSILEALRQLETGGSQPGPGEVPPVLERDRSRWPWYALAACGVGIFMFWVLWPSPRDLVAPAPGPGASIADAEALPPAAPAPRPSAANTEPPRARIASQATAPVAEPPEERVADRTPEQVAAPRFEAPPRYENPAPDASASAGVGRTIPRPPGEPIVRISSLSYSSSPTRRVVSLSVNNSNPISVREGERVGGVEVTLIMPDSIYVKHAGNIFAVSR